MEIDTKGLYRMDVQGPVDKKKNVTSNGLVEHVWSYKMIYNSGIDGGWEKSRDGEAWEHLYLLPSQSKYFTVDLNTKTKRDIAKTADGIAKLSQTLTLQAYKRFWNRMDRSSITYNHEVFDKFKTTEYFTNNLMKLLDDAAFPPLAKMGLGKLSTLNLDHWYYDVPNRDLITSGGDTGQNLKLFKYVVDKAVASGMNRDIVMNDIKNNYRYDRINSSLMKFFQACRGLYGIDTTKRWFVDRWFEDTELNGADGSMSSLFGTLGGTEMDDCNYNGDIEKASHDGYNVFDAEALSNYIFIQSKKQGKRKNVGSFISMLKDCYRFQRRLYGKIREKYPEHLATYHDKLEDDVSVLNEAGLSNEQYAPKAQQAKKYEGEYGDFKLIVLETAADVVDEARLQGGTCVGSYVQKVIAGDDYILSLRRKNAPAIPVCTLEISNNKPVQFLGYMNRSATAEEWDALYHIMLKFYKKANLASLYGETVKLIEKNKPRLEEERRNKPKEVQAEL